MHVTQQITLHQSGWFSKETVENPASVTTEPCVCFTINPCYSQAAAMLPAVRFCGACKLPEPARCTHRWMAGLGVKAQQIYVLNSWFYNCWSTKLACIFCKFSTIWFYTAKLMQIYLASLQLVSTRRMNCRFGFWGRYSSMRPNVWAVQVHGISHISWNMIYLLLLSEMF